MKKNSAENTGPGRPRYQMKYPTTKRWTFQDLEETNKVDLETGKGPNCTKLTLTKNMDRDLWIREVLKNGKRGKIIRSNPKSVAVRLTDIFAEPTSKDGLGRKGYVYSLRAKLDGKVGQPVKGQPAKGQPVKTRKARTPKTTGLSDATKQYEEIKAILATPTPAPAPETPAPVAETPAAVTVPAVTVTPAPEPAPAPVAETPAPAPETSTAPVAQESANAETATPVANS